MSGQGSSDARRAGVVVLVVGGALLGFGLWLLVPWHPVPGGTPRHLGSADLLDPAHVAQAEAYSTRSRWIGRSSLAVSLTVVVALALPRVRDAWTARLRGPHWLRVVTAVVVVLMAVRLATLPFAVASVRERRAVGLTEQPWGAWALDLLKQEAVQVGVTALALVVLLGLVRRLPRAWPVVAAAGAAGFVLVGSLAYPVVVEPVFNSFTPLEDGDLRTEVLALADREGVEVDEVLVADASRRTTSLNAYVSGFGATRRVVLYDTLVDSMGEREALAVVAHEMSHARHDDVLVGTTLGAAGAATALGAVGVLLGGAGRRRLVSGAAVVPVLLAAWAVGNQAVSPLVNGVSRQMEMRADVDAVRFTGDPEAFVRMQRMLAERALADPTPQRWSQFWWGSHPTFGQRVEIARRVAGEGQRLKTSGGMRSKSEVTAPPKAITAVVTAMAIRVTMRPYSTAVAPRSSRASLPVREVRESFMISPGSTNDERRTGLALTCSPSPVRQS